MPSSAAPESNSVGSRSHTAWIRLVVMSASRASTSVCPYRASGAASNSSTGLVPSAAAEGTRPVLLLEAAPLARYGHTDVLARLADITTRRIQAVWLLLPTEFDSGAALDGIPLPLAHGGQFLLLDDDWLLANQPEGEPA